jgi:hypothetical protein
VPAGEIIEDPGRSRDFRAGKGSFWYLGWPGLPLRSVLNVAMSPLVNCGYLSMQLPRAAIVVINVKGKSKFEFYIVYMFNVGSFLHAEYHVPVPMLQKLDF